MKKFLSEYPELISEWHPTKNGELKPEEFTHGNIKKVWWLCPKGHSYGSTINDRTRKDKPRGCPYCSGRRASDGNNLLSLFPKIADEWHPTKNGELKPNKVTHGSDKKVWWLCPKGHEYDSRISHRTGKIKSGCPQCSGRMVSSKNNLKFLFPKIAKEWHPTKNGELKPDEVTFGSGKKVWWLCSKGHSFENTINQRTSNKSGCPHCYTDGRNSS